MSKKQKKIFWPAILIILAGCSAFLFVSARNRSSSSTEGKEARIKHIAPTPASATAQRSVRRVRRAALRQQLHKILDVLGNRLEHPGKERVTREGTLSLAGVEKDSRVRVINEFPDKLQLVRQGAGVVACDGQRATKGQGALDQIEEALLETLVNDTTEHFLQIQVMGVPGRFLGTRFRLDDGTSANYSGPSYDIYQVTDTVRVGAITRQQIKLYYFNSDTQLLERVRYQPAGGGNIEVRLDNWQMIAGQQLPTRITRFENEQVVFQLAFTSAGLGPAAKDGIFTAQGN